MDASSPTVYSETVSPSGDVPAAVAGGATFEELYSMLAGLAVHRPAPPRLEVSELVDSVSTRHALLLELPEPVDTSRLDLTVLEGGIDVTAEITVVWKGDATKAFVFRGPNFAAGSYTIQAVFELDGDAQLSRGGSTTAETAGLAFELT